MLTVTGVGQPPQAALATGFQSHTYGNVAVTPALHPADVHPGSPPVVPPFIPPPGQVPAQAAVPAQGSTSQDGAQGVLYQNIAMPTAKSAKPARGKAGPGAGSAAAVAAAQKRVVSVHDEQDEDGAEVYDHEDLYASYSPALGQAQLDAFQKYLMDCLASPQQLEQSFGVSGDYPLLLMMML